MYSFEVVRYSARPLSPCLACVVLYRDGRGLDGSRPDSRHIQAPAGSSGVQRGPGERRLTHPIIAAELDQQADSFGQPAGCFRHIMTGEMRGQVAGREEGGGGRYLEALEPLHLE